jgi:hypothetical protein
MITGDVTFYSLFAFSKTQEEYVQFRRIVMFASFFKLSLFAPAVLTVFGRRVIKTMKNKQITARKTEETTVKGTQAPKSSRNRRIRRLSLILNISIFAYIPYGLFPLCVAYVNENFQHNHSVLLLAKLCQDSYFIFVNAFIALFPRNAD